MALKFTDEQNMLVDAVGRYFEDRAPLNCEARRTSSVDWDPEVWRGLAQELGVLGLTFPEAQGGLGCGHVETMIVMEAIGRHLVVTPFLETVIVGGGILQDAGGPVAEALIAKIIEGEARIAFAHSEAQARYCAHDVRSQARATGEGYVLNGAKVVVAVAPIATHYIVSARTAGGPRDREGISLFLVDAAAKGVSRRDYRTIDWRPASDIVFDNVALETSARLGEADAALPLVEAALDRATLAICAEATSVLRAIHSATVEFTKQRRQFGVPLSSFQVLRHRMVDMYIGVEEATALSRQTSRDWDEGFESPAARAEAVSVLKVCVGNACEFVGESGIQLHGGMGITDELAVSHYFKRAKVIQQSYGSVDHHLTRFQAGAFASAAERAS